MQTLLTQLQAQATVQAQTFYEIASTQQHTRDVQEALMWAIVVTAGLLICLLCWRLLSLGFGPLNRPTRY